jgi:plasmid stabilization system protein ParE
MAFKLVWTPAAQDTYEMLSSSAKAASWARKESKKKKSSKAERLFKQINKCIQLLQQNPRHPSLQTDEFASMPNPYAKDQKVFVACAQQKTPGAYRVFWCYGPGKGQITIIAITPHP